MKFRFLYITIAIAILGIFTLPETSFAQLDQRCWLEKDCLQQRKDISLDTLNSKQLKEGFVQNSETVAACGTSVNAAGDKIGFCLPVGQAETTISFGGQRRFANFGEFIKEMYRYGTWAATIIAVFVVVISGIQWMVSGGNSGMIDSAKKRIGGAIIGLTLLALSYTILGMINPYLVNLRLPSVWLVNEIEVAPPYCSQVSGSGKLYEISSKANEKIDIATKEGLYTKNKDKGVYTKTKQEAKCGFEYLVEGAAAQSCTGSVCLDDQGKIAQSKVCAPFDIDESQQKKAGSDCLNGDVVVHMKVSAPDQQLFQGSWLAGATGASTVVGTKEVVKAPEWLDDNDQYIYYSCDGGQTYENVKAGDYLFIHTAKPIAKAAQGFLPVPGSFNEHELHFQNLHRLMCKGNKLPDRFFFKFDIELSGETGEPNAYLGRIGATNEGIIGSYGMVKNFPILMAEITSKGGIYIDASLTRGGMNDIASNKSSEPPAPAAPKITPGVDPMTGQSVVPAGAGKI